VRYLLRPLISADRLTMRPDGRVEYRFRRPDPTGRTSWVTDGPTWVRRLATLIPPRRSHSTRFHGVLASAHRWRAARSHTLVPGVVRRITWITSMPPPAAIALRTGPRRAHRNPASTRLSSTGATAGIGRMTALHLAKRGHRVIATGRKSAELAKLKTEAGDLPLDTLQLDVTSAASIASAVQAIDALTAGRGIDLLVNNAGFGVLGPTSEIDDADVRAQFETNVFGLMSVTRAFLPQMRARRSGRIINISSVGGRITLPYFGVYNSTTRSSRSRMRSATSCARSASTSR